MITVTHIFVHAVLSVIGISLLNQKAAYEIQINNARLMLFFPPNYEHYLIKTKAIILVAFIDCMCFLLRGRFR